MIELKDLVIDEEMHRLLPRLPEHEFAGLRQDMLANGCLKPIIVWLNHSLVLDGRHRLEICLAEGLDAEIREMSFPSRDDAQEWIWRHQLDQRNLDPKSIAELRGRLAKCEETRLKASSGQSVQNPTGGLPTPAKRQANRNVAKSVKSSEKTVERDRAFADAMEAIDSVNGKFGADIRSGAIKLSKRDVIAIAKGDIAAACKNIRNGLPWNSNGKPVVGEGPQPKPPDPPMLDALGGTVPANLEAVFREVTTFKGIGQRIGKLHNELKEIAESEAGACLPLPEIHKVVSDFKAAVKFARPYTECPRCRRKPMKECKLCSGLGWITEMTFRRSKTEADEKWLGNRK